jgi:hypothetical protein
MNENALAHPYLEEALPGFHRARAVVKTNKDSLHPLGFDGHKQEFCRFATPLSPFRQQLARPPRCPASLLPGFIRSDLMRRVGCRSQKVLAPDPPCHSPIA